MSKAEAKGRPTMASPIRIKYGGRVLELNPETSIRIRKLARKAKRTVEYTVVGLLKKTTCAAPGLFLPARC